MSKVDLNNGTLCAHWQAAITTQGRQHNGDTSTSNGVNGHSHHGEWRCLHCGVTGLTADDARHHASTTSSSTTASTTTNDSQQHGAFVHEPSDTCWCFVCNREVSTTQQKQLLQQQFSSSSTSSYISHRPRGGLVNCGNTCFANACLQALAACDPLAAHVGQDLWRGDDESVEQQLLTAPLTRLTGDVFRRIAQGGEAAVQPTELLEHLRFLKPTFVHGSQQDAMECVRTLLDGLHEENKYFVRKRRRIHENDNNLMAAAASSPLAVRSPPHASPLRFASPLSASTNSTVSSPRSPLSRSMPAPVSPSVAEPPEEQSVVACICSGLLLSRVFCLSCENVSDTVDPFTDLPAPIPQEEQSASADCRLAQSRRSRRARRARPAAECRRRRRRGRAR
jgi:hypothetical protein